MVIDRTAGCDRERVCPSGWGDVPGCRKPEAARIKRSVLAFVLSIVIWATGLDLPSDADFAQWDQIVTATSSAIETAVLEAEQRRLLARKYENTRVWELFARASWHFTRARFDDN